MIILEDYRKEIVKELFGIKSFSDAWGNSWEQKVKGIIGDNLTEEKLFEIGEKAREIFFSTSDGRGQGAVSSAGTAWECFLAWYLNLGLVGTRTIVIKPKKQFNLESIKDTLTVNYGEFTSSSETDLIAITFPIEKELCYSLEYLKNHGGDDFSLEQLNNIEPYSLKEIRNRLNELAKDNISRLKVNVIQCKTNWNDNAQIPMAWDMIYSSTGFQGKDISIGKNELSIHKLKDFKYSFMTVPTQSDLDKFKTSSTHVLRVKNLSGKNFWGNETKSGVAYSLGEAFKLNYKESYEEKLFGERIIDVDLEYFNL